MKISKIIIVLHFISYSLYIRHTISAKILYFSSIGCKSTASLHQAISKILIDNYHKIIAISPLPLDQNLANYTDLGMHEDFFQLSDKFTIQDVKTGTYISRKRSYQIQHSNCKNLYRNASFIETLNMLQNQNQIDLILLEIDNAECYYPLIAQFKVPIIGVYESNFLFPDLEGLMGNAVNPSYVPTPMSGFSSRMNFFQRLLNTKDYVLHLMINWYYTREANAIAEKYLKNRPRDELHDRISLVFSNTHFTFLSKPTAPNTVHIAGIHMLEEPSSLPQEIQFFIDTSPRGVIYLSLGSVLKFSGLPKQIHDLFEKKMQDLPYRVIWRHDKPEMVSNTSKNILVRKWLPQREILAQPKTVLFISHCGLFSIYEAVHFAVPMVNLPIRYDQFTNAAIIQNLKIGIPLDFNTLNESILISSIEEVVQNKKYKENIEKLSNIFKDRPSSPRETLIYWVDYVLRHKNVSYLTPAGAKLPFYRYLLLDVILFSSSILAMITLIIYFIFKNTVLILRKLAIEKSAIQKTKTS